MREKPLPTSADQELQLELAPNAGQCATFRRCLRTLCAAVGFDGQPMQDLLLGAGEALTNAIKYGKCRDGDTIHIRITASSRQVTVDLCYRGECFRHHLPDYDDIRQLENGGLGRYLMYHVLDQVAYKFESGLTSVMMIKRSRPRD